MSTFDPTTKTNRRGFLSATAATAGTLALARSVHGRGAAAPKALKMGVIGVGWYGMVDAMAALKVGGVEVTAVCDVDSEHLNAAADQLEKLQGKRPATYKLHAEMLKKADLDVVAIGSPPHWHALQLIDCIKHGLDVYEEKPLAYDIREGRAMADCVSKSDRIVQVGFQRRQSAAFKQAAAAVKAGKIGQLVQADVQIHHRAGTKDTTPQAPPAALDWDLWCGPAPKIPYSPQVGHKSWRLETTTGHGHLVDWGIHNVDATRMMLGLGMPNRITAAGGIYHLQGKITTPDTLTVHFDFDRLPVVWRHRLWGATEYNPEVNNGVFLYGDEGTIFVSDQKWVFVPTGKSAQREEHTAPADLGALHMANFLDCVRTRKQPDCQIEQGFQATATVQLAMIAYESASVVQWDSKTEQILHNPAAAKLLKREYRKPYVHPYQG
ncbi:MAG: Gfo/Idh/MocA family oxidoreductase [Candidatus Nealsonbacteria bacterium]|nr:Gfo/Idh/MocA family oxidoreductase [Candidatus Nealsonbacteria bacterium]